MDTNGIAPKQHQATTVIAEGYAYDPATRDWTKLVEYVARDRIEAIRWINFNRDYFKRLAIR